MAKSYRQLLIDADVHEELLGVRARVSDLFFHVEGQLGLSSTIKVLLAHFAAVPPAEGWLREQTKGLPIRGRPRKSDPAYTPLPKGDGSKNRAGHRWVSPKARPDISFCTVCEDMKHPDNPEGRGMLVCTPTRQQATMEMLAHLSFTPEEVTWLR